MISVNKNLQLNLPPDVGLGHDALQTIAEFKKCLCLWVQARQKLQVNRPQLAQLQRKHVSALTFNRRLALKMDLKPNCK